MKSTREPRRNSFLKSLLIMAAIIAIIPSALSQGIAINEIGTPRDASSLLDVSSTAKGILVPRMTLSQRNAIASPATGLLIYQTDNTPGFYYNAGTPASKNWKMIGHNAGVFSQWTSSGSDIYYNSGNVGIGTATPSHKLTVGGDALINGVRVGFGGGFGVGQGNTALGQNVLQNNSAGSANTAAGSFAMSSNVSGFENAAFGFSALTSNTSGSGNTALGSEALFLNNGSYNTAVGQMAMLNNANGRFNTAVGYQALISNTNAFSNVAVGVQALLLNSTRSNLVAVGDSALFYNGLDAVQSFHATCNTAVGSKALCSNTIGYNNTAVGFQALTSNIDGVSNTAIGSRALSDNQYGTGNTAVGIVALRYNVTGNQNTATGALALSSNLNGSNNTAFGFRALLDNTDGSDNTAVGFDALYKNKANSRTTAIGVRAMYYADNRTSGRETYNTAVGFEALRGSITIQNNSGQANTAIGDQALLNNSLGYENTAIGYRALMNNSLGFQNTSVGANSSLGIGTGDYNTSIGYNTGPNSSNLDNVTCIGIDATGTATDQVRVGNIFVQSIGGYKDWTNISDDRFKVEVKETVPGLEFIKMLRPVSYRIDHEKINDAIGVTERREKIRAENPDVKFLTGERYSEITTGFIAQEVEAAARQLGFEFSGVDAPRNENDLYGLRYASFVVPIVKAIQEQQQQIENLEPAKVESLTKELEELRSENEEIRAQISDLLSIVGSLGENMQQCCNQSLKENFSPGNEIPLIPDKAMLEQNIPNPFYQQTVIRYYLPDDNGKASIIITDMNGIKLREFELNSVGFGLVTVNAGSLPPGTYVYSLILNDRLVDSKRMVILRW